MKKSLLYIFGIVVLLQLSSCAPSKPAEETRMVSPDRLIKKLEANRRKIKTFNGSGWLMIDSQSMNAKSSFEVMIKKPDSIKVSFYGPFGIDLAQVLITQNYFQFYDNINNTLYQGRMRNDIMKQLLKIDLPFDEVINALTGSVNLTDKLRKEPDDYEFVDDRYRLAYKDSVNSIESIYFVRSSDMAITENLINNNLGRKLLEGNYSRFNVLDEVPVPFEINLEDSYNKQRMKVEYKNAEVNKPLSNFNLDIPNDAKVIEW